MRPTRLAPRALALLLALSACAPATVALRPVPAATPAAPAASTFAILDAYTEPLRSDFDRDASHVRLLVLASPT